MTINSPGLRASLYFALLGMIAPLLIFIAWAADPSFLYRVFDGSPQMVPWTAVALVSSGLALVAATRSHVKVAPVFGGMTVAVAIFFLVEYVVGLHLDVDLWFFRSSVQFNPAAHFPGRPSPQTCVGLFSLGLSQILHAQSRFENRPRLRASVQIFAATTLTIAILATLGYLYNAVHLFRITQFTGVSLLTAASLFLLGFATLQLDAGYGIIRAYAQENQAGLFLRRFALGGVIAPFVVAGLIGFFEQREILTASDGMGLFIFFTVASIATLAMYVSRSLEQIDRQNNSLETQRVDIASANEASRLKDKFVTNMSHELRTPMMAILGYLDLLRDPMVETLERTDLATKAERSARGLLGVLDDVLDIAKIEADRVQIVRSAFTIRSLVDDVVSVLMLEAERKKIDLKVEFEPGVPEKLISDPQRVRQVLLNLAGNSVKFTDRGSIVIRVGRDVVTGGGQVLFFEVSDTGIGIDTDKQSHLFQAFFQVDDSITRKFGGTGLGLAISQNFADLLGGKLLLKQSSTGAGSTFRFELPFSTPEAVTSRDAAKVAAKADLAGLEVLLVEDNIDNQFLITRYLKSAGASVEIAQNGQEAIDRARVKTYAVILMDLQMPVMGGLEATRLLRAEGYKAPIVALTAHVRIEQREESMAAGCSAHVSKPISKNELLDVVQRFSRAL